MIYVNFTAGADWLTPAGAHGRAHIMSVWRRLPSSHQREGRAAEQAEPNAVG
jgi:hypothetical protein